jgi:hypothetical protein
VKAGLFVQNDFACVCGMTAGAELEPAGIRLRVKIGDQAGAAGDLWHDMVPTLSTGEAESETDVARVQRPTCVTKLASGRHWLEGIDQSAVRRHARELGG